MHHSARIGIAIAILASGVLGAGCASTPSEPEVMREAEADFGSYQTFGWYTPDSKEKSGQPTSIVDGYVRTAIASELKSKGYAEAPAGAAPDLTIEYEAASTDKVKDKPFRVGVGVGSIGSHAGGSVGVGSPGAKTVKEGSLVVHVVDAARKSEVWRGSLSREIGKDGVKPEAVRAAVAELLRDFPARDAPP
jgi:hypothetical protein